MKENIKRIPANNNELTLYCYVGEAIWKIQIAEQALSHSITLKTNPAETKERVDEILKKHQRLTLGQSIKIALSGKLYTQSLLDELSIFLEQRNWLTHSAMPDSQHGLNWEDKKEELFQKIKAISNKAENIQREIEYDLIAFCSDRGKDMSKIRVLLKLQEQGVRVRVR